MRNSRNWSGKVTQESNALDLEHGVFTWDDPKKIALSLKESAENKDLAIRKQKSIKARSVYFSNDEKYSLRRKTIPFQSAMSMLNFYINRAGKNLPEEREKILNLAKEELRKVFGRIN